MDLAGLSPPPELLNLTTPSSKVYFAIALEKRRFKTRINYEIIKSSYFSNMFIYYFFFKDVEPLSLSEQ